MNPYWDRDFFGFFALLIKRCFLFVSGQEIALASDEVQLIALVMLAIAASLLGPFLILRRMSMLANSLSHTALLGIVLSALLLGGISYDLKALFLASLISAFVTTLLTEMLTKLFKLQEDASIGLVFTSLFALGVVFVTLFTKNGHIGAEAVMGNLDAIHVHDLTSLSFLLAANALFVLLFFRRLALISFDTTLAKSFGVRVSLLHYALLFLASFTVMGAFRVVGVILVLSFLVGPYLTARLFSSRLKPLLYLSALFGVMSSLVGVALSRHFFSMYGMALSTGSIVVVIIMVQFFFALATKEIKERLHKRRNRIYEIS